MLSTWCCVEKSHILRVLIWISLSATYSPPLSLPHRLRYLSLSLSVSFLPPLKRRTAPSFFLLPHSTWRRYFSVHCQSSTWNQKKNHRQGYCKDLKVQELHVLAIFYSFKASIDFLFRCVIFLWWFPPLTGSSNQFPSSVSQSSFYLTLQAIVNEQPSSTLLLAMALLEVLYSSASLLFQHLMPTEFRQSAAELIRQTAGEILIRLFMGNNHQFLISSTNRNWMVIL